MSVKIGSKYTERLEMIKNSLIGLRNGGYQEFPEVLVLENEGTCFYYGCCDKKRKADREVRFVYENGREKERKTEAHFFHAECLEKLLKDKRLEGMN